MVNSPFATVGHRAFQEHTDLVTDDTILSEMERAFYLQISLSDANFQVYILHVWEEDALLSSHIPVGFHLDPCDSVKIALTWQNYQDLYGKLLELGWRANHLLLVMVSVKNSSLADSLFFLIFPPPLPISKSCMPAASFCSD